jgi:phenylpropionate dioxygenase-like ring-hydroxylating dioxygenase large terminal subunit
MISDEKKETTFAAGEPLRGFWYPALAGDELRRGQMRRVILLDTPLLVGRDKRGAVFALDDHCPHRGIPLTDGNFDGELIECCYHGWRFDCEGVCREIPALLPDSPVKPERIRAPRFECRESDKLVWVFMPEGKRGELTELPTLAVHSEPYLIAHVSRPLRCNIDHGIVGLMDPAHGPFVHQAWWWRSKGSIREKAKQFEPIPNGFRMTAHAPSTNSAIYKLLNLYKEPVTTQIDFTLPNVRAEQVRCGPYWFYSRATVTPITDTECRLDFVAAWNILRWIPFITKPLFHLLANQFIGQDQRIMEKQAAGLRDQPKLILIDDSDTQAKWYYQLKAAHQKQQQTGGGPAQAMDGPVTLRWRS